MLCRYGKRLKHACSTLKHADEEVLERVLRLENGLLKFEHRLDFTQRIKHLMSEEHQEIYHRTLVVFLSKLELVNSMLTNLGSADGPLRAKFKYAWKKERLDEAIEELEVWQRTTDHSWFLLMRIADPGVDATLATTDLGTLVSTRATSAIRASLSTALPATAGSRLTLDFEEISRMMVKNIDFSEAKMVTRAHESREIPSYILNEFNIPQPIERLRHSKRQMLKKDTRDLARRLRHDDPPETFGLLACKGFAMDREGTKNTLVFRVPPSIEGPRSLRDLLLNAESPKSLTQRFEMAKELAKSVSYVHTFGFVHKNIRPESVLSFISTDGRSRSTFLVGLNNFRRDEGHTERKGDCFLERNLYRHSSRQGSSPSLDYIMQHDIYSLGVCLLEVGLWQSFIEYPEVDGERKPQLSSVLGVPTGLNLSQAVQYLSSEAKKRLVQLAQDELPQYMGTKYTDIAVTCLTCLDPDNENFGDEKEFQDEDGIRVGVRYIEKVSRRLETCKLEFIRWPGPGASPSERTECVTGH